MQNETIEGMMRREHKSRQEAHCEWQDVMTNRMGLRVSALAHHTSCGAIALHLSRDVDIPMTSDSWHCRQNKDTCFAR